MYVIAFLLLWPTLAHAHAGSHVDGPAVATAIALGISGSLYARAIMRRAQLSRGNIAAFAAGWSCLLAALLSPLDAAAETSFSLHMIQHQLLMIVAPPLMILGRPFTALAATLPPTALRIAAWPLRTPPSVAWGLHAAALWIWHVPALFDDALASEWLHALQHASFFFTAMLFWWAVIRRVRTGMAVFYVLATLVHAGSLAALLTFAPTPLYADTLLAEQQMAGLIMWVPAGYGLLFAGMLAFNRLMEIHA